MSYDKIISDELLQLIMAEANIQFKEYRENTPITYEIKAQDYFEYWLIAATIELMGK